MSGAAITEDELAASIAIVGMAGRFPGAADVAELWQNLVAGVESITHFSDDELSASGVPADLLSDPSYVKAGRVLERIEEFDAAFFGYTPREAQVMDPQQRIFLEEAWSVLEAAGCDPDRFDGSIGVFAGAALSTYLMQNLATNRHLDGSVSVVQVVLGNDKDSLATRTAYALDLQGPCYGIQSYCSTSLVAVCAASTSLLAGECDLALAGGAAVSVPHRVGYLYQEGGMSSSDARCRTFDAAAEGTPIGNGVALVALKRADEAIAAGDHIHALIRGWAVNNDGARKVGFTAPGVRGQAGVVAEALANADIDPASIGYIEAHGTGTALGDAAEVAALKQVFGDLPAGSCAIGSVKTNLGHLDRAAGVTGLIKAALAVEHAVIPPTLNFERPNPQADLENSPFEVVTETRAWNREGPRRAGVSAFGIGGTNAHVVVEEPPARARAPEAEPGRGELIVLSARTAEAADQACTRLASWWRGSQETPAAVASSLRGRREFAHRRALVAGSREQALEALTEGRMLAGEATVADRPVGLLIAGVGEHYAGMAASLFTREPVFRDEFERCAELLGGDLERALVEPRAAAAESDPAAGFARMLGRAPAEASGELGRPSVAQPALFAVEYALGRLLASWGITPAAMLGYSLGEYVAAALAGALELPQALALVKTRSELIDALPPGAMTAVPLDAAALAGELPPELDVAALNGPAMAVVAGTAEAVQAFEERLAAREVPARRLLASHAFHSRMLGPIAAPLTDWAREHVHASAPRTPYISNLTGTWITADDLSDPGYWARHATSPVQFARGLETLLADPDLALAEVGPGQSLGAMARTHPECARERWPRIVPTLPGQHEPGDDQHAVAEGAGRLWLTGARVDWSALGPQGQPKVPLPAYPFQRQRYWIDAPAPEDRATPAAAPASAEPAREPVLHTFDWRPAEVAPAGEVAGPVLVLADACGVADGLIALLAEEGLPAAVVRPGSAFAADGDRFSIRPSEDADYDALARQLKAEGRVPATVAHMWSVDGEPAVTDPDALEARQLSGFASICRLARAIDSVATDTVRIAIVSDRMQAAAPGEVAVADKATLLGPCKVIPQEYPDVHCRSIDVDLGAADLPRRLLDELRWPEGPALVALREARLTQELAPAPDQAEDGVALREDGAYLITGGLGGVGLLLAEHLVRDLGARVALTTRSQLPPRDAWQPLIDADPDGDRAAALRGILELDPDGDRVLVVRADVCDEREMRAAIATVRERLGGLDGVIHAAAVTDPGSFRPLEQLDDAAWRTHFGAKLHGTLVLERVLADEPLDFVLLQSSMSSVLGGLGFASYSAANAFLDAVPGRHLGEPTRWMSIDWDTWEPTVRKIAGSGIGASMIENSLTTEHALDALGRCLALALPRVVVAAGELEPRMRKWLTAEGKLAAKPASGPERFARPELAEAYVPASSSFEREVATLWQEVLGLDRVGMNDNFFDLGGNSLMGLQLITRVKKEFGVRVPAVAMFEAPTIRTLAKYLAADGDGDEASAAASAPPSRRSRARNIDEDAVAIVGMAGRFPGAASVAELWENLRSGTESVSFFSDEELREAGVAEELIAHPRYVKARPVLDRIDEFDADFFGYTAREAALTDPQHRLFLEVVWEALEDAGYAARGDGTSVGVFAGTNVSTYLLGLLSDPELVRDAGDVQAIMDNDKDALTTSVSYKLDLTGPSLALQSFSSTSLVAVHYASRSLLNGECDVAIAGGASIHVPDRVGHLYEEGGQLSPDGHVRTFDADAGGRMLGDAVAAVALKRLSDAVEDRDRILAVIRGSAVNNDGSMKAGFETPSVAGLVSVVSEALDAAGVRPDEISYVEAYGTGTPMGDPIEVAALARVFGRGATGKHCVLGSVKPNLGHLEHAAGVTGLIKTVLAMQHEQVPPTLHFRSPNPDIDFEHSPFEVSAEGRPWPADPQRPRRAGVTAVGRGGTNAHVVLEEPPSPVRPPAATPRGPELLVLSARTAAAADESASRLASWLRGAGAEADLGDVAWSLRVGRREFEHRRAVVAATSEEAATALEAHRPAEATMADRPVAFLLAGVGEHHPGMAASLFAREPVFREAFERCAELCGGDLERALVEPDATAAVVAQPALFAVEYALGRLLASWGIVPSAMLGYSLGEYVAAALSGALELDEVLALVRERARLIDALPAGAVHSRLLDPIAGPLTDWARDHVHPRAPRTPYVSNLTGTWITERELADPGYWARHATGTVQFARGLETLLEDPDLALVEIGPGQSLGAIARAHPACERDRWSRIVATLPAQHDPSEDARTVADAVGRLWLAGVGVDWRSYQPDGHRRTPLPTYPFQRRRHWIGPKSRVAAAPWNEPKHNGDAPVAVAATDGQEERA